MRDHAGVPAVDPRFYLAAMSPYAWIAAERIGRVMPQARWTPVTAAFVFKANGRTSWGLTDEREEGMVAAQARAAERGLGPIRWPQPWPTSDVPVARAMTFADRRGLLRSFALEAMRLAFLEGRDLAELETILEAGRRSGIDAGELERALADEEIKLALRQATDAAVAAGVFGVPTVIVGDQLFWGDDRLDEAAAAGAAAARP